MGTRTVEAVVAGYVCLDILPGLDERHRGKALTVPGSLVMVGPADFRAGGVVGNTGLALHHMGIETRLMGKVGADLAGKVILEALRAHGASLADEMVVSEGETSAYAVVVSPPGADRCFWAHPGANDTFASEDIDCHGLTGRRLFHFGYPTLMRRMWMDEGEALADMFLRVKEQGLITSLDMSTPDPDSECGKANWARILESVLPHVDIFLPSLPEVLFMLDRPRFEALRAECGSPEITPLADAALLSRLGEQLVSMGCVVGGLKLGDQGLYVRTADRARFNGLAVCGVCDPASWADRELLAPCFGVDAAGTTGAGDATVAGFLSGLLRGMDLPRVLDVATAAGACRVECPDAPPRWDAILERIAAGWPRRPLRIPRDGWRPDTGTGLWTGPLDRHACGASQSNPAMQKGVMPACRR